MKKLLLLCCALMPWCVFAQGTPPGAYNASIESGDKGETFGTQLRRLAAGAAISNPVFNAPLGPASAWAVSTAYQIGQVVSNGGYQYICSVAGTSASSGGPTGQAMGPIERDSAVKAARGGGFWSRFRSGVKWFAIGAATGAVAASAARH